MIVGHFNDLCIYSLFSNFMTYDFNPDLFSDLLVMNLHSYLGHHFLKVSWRKKLTMSQYFSIFFHIESMKHWITSKDLYTLLLFSRESGHFQFHLYASFFKGHYKYLEQLKILKKRCPVLSELVVVILTRPWVL